MVTMFRVAIDTDAAAANDEPTASSLKAWVVGAALFQMVWWATENLPAGGSCYCPPPR